MDVWRPARWAGGLFGALMGLFWPATLWFQGQPPLVALGLGAASGLVSGLLFGLIAALFLRAPSVRAQIELDSDELLPGERLLDSRLANLVVKPADFGIGEASLGDLYFLAGMRGREIVGGALHLTNLRLLFKAHRWNRLRGRLSVFLPQIEGCEPRARWPYRRLALQACGLELELAAIDRDGLLALIEAARSDFGPEERGALERLQQQVRERASLQPDRALNAINSLIHRGRQAGDVVELASRPLSALAALIASEAFDRGIAEHWSRRVRNKGARAANAARKALPETGHD
jgi:hypothetical protein